MPLKMWAIYALQAPSFLNRDIKSHLHWLPVNFLLQISFDFLWIFHAPFNAMFSLIIFFLLSFLYSVAAPMPPEILFLRNRVSPFNIFSHALAAAMDLDPSCLYHLLPFSGFLECLFSGKLSVLDWFHLRSYDNILSLATFINHSPF